MAGGNTIQFFPEFFDIFYIPRSPSKLLIKFLNFLLQKTRRYFRVAFIIVV